MSTQIQILESDELFCQTRMKLCFFFQFCVNTLMERALEATEANQCTGSQRLKALSCETNQTIMNATLDERSERSTWQH